MNETLSKTELKELVEVLDTLEWGVLLPIKRLSGCFAEAVMFDYDDEYVDIELKFGVQNDTKSTIYTETYKYNRKTKKVEDA